MRIIEVLGPGCSNCQRLERVAAEAVATTGIDADIRHVTNYVEIAARGVMSTPGLVIDGRVVSYGRIPSVDDVIGWLGAS
jgi:small redox-active disulfide protein 2